MPLDYIGSELELFAQAKNWKAHVARNLAPFIRGRVLEVGAGIGSNINQLTNSSVLDWLAVEPDRRLADEISRGIDQGTLPASCRALCGTIDAVPAEEQFDAILYIDVLEHIEDDHAEVVKAARHLAPGGFLIVLVPAYQFLYSPFDRAIGHFRRYVLADLKRLTPAGCKLARAFMLDSVGLFASLANRLILHSPMPTPAQIATWDRALVPLSRLIDPVVRYRLGKSAIIVWEK